MDIQENIVTWLKTLKGWQTELAYRILQKQIESSDIVDIISMIQSNTPFVEKTFPNFATSIGERQLRLTSIEAIQNIESLAPRNSLIFENTKNLIVIYGSNGSGKSGYTKLLKKAAGKQRAINLKTNVYNSESKESKCTIKYSIDSVEKSENWIMNSNTISDLSLIDLFDTNTGDGYLKEANTVTYTPNCLLLFERIVYLYSEISNKLTEEKSRLLKNLPTLLTEYQNTDSGRLYKNLNKNHTETSLATILVWTDTDESNKKSLEKRLQEKDPIKAAIEKRKQKSEVDKIISELTQACSLIGKKAREELTQLKNTATEKRIVAQKSAKIISSTSEIQGVGTQTWKALWEAAKEFSLMEAYKDTDFPKVDNDSRCVLCHQVLDEKAKQRLSSFETFIKSTVEKEAAIAEKAYLDKINTLPATIKKDVLTTKCGAANLNDEWLNCLVSIWQQIESVSTAIKQDSEISIDAQYISDNIKILQEISDQYENEAKQFEEDAKSFDRAKATDQLLELNAKKWCSQQKTAILNEIQRLKNIDNYDNWVSQCNTMAISRKASEISEIVITEEYVKRFNQELTALNANKIKVELVKDRTTKGKVSHTLKLRGNDTHRPIEILSEGENRIVALAAFLADVTGGNNNNPFIFDDPISSLDQQYEEKTVERIVELSKTRQIIVFTHRLSLLGLLNDKADSDNIQIVGIRTEHWGCGEIGDTPLFAKKTETAFKYLKNQKIAQAKKIFTEQGSEMYYPYGKMLCSDIRILVERSVEIDLLSDVVQRYRRAVKTMGKIDKLAKITKEDCDLINSYMTKYSKYEHSQPTEEPVEIPEPTEIESDVDALINWISEFKNR
jgi:energy-coupling factor transporter ATP-binding protein EcfA2